MEAFDQPGPWEKVGAYGFRRWWDAERTYYAAYVYCSALLTGWEVWDHPSKHPHALFAEGTLAVSQETQGKRAADEALRALTALHRQFAGVFTALPDSFDGQGRMRLPNHVHCVAEALKQGDATSFEALPEASQQQVRDYLRWQILALLKGGTLRVIAVMRALQAKRELEYKQARNTEAYNSRKLAAQAVNDKRFKEAIRERDFQRVKLYLEERWAKARVAARKALNVNGQISETDIMEMF